MKSIELIFISILVILIIGCNSNKHLGSSPKYNFYTAEVNFIAKESEGTITVNSIGYGKNKKSAIINAKQNCFSILLFKGIPGSEINIPLVDNEYKSKTANSNFYNSFFNGTAYETFIMRITESSYQKNKRVIKTGLELQININSLRKYLEQNNIIRKLGY